MTDIEAIRARRSVRSFDGKGLEDGARSALQRILESSRVGPFGSDVGLALVDLSEDEGAFLRAKVTYGVIHGARSYVVGSVAGPRATVDFGHCLERVILEATKLGLGTCWIGGTFHRSAFAERARVEEGRLIPCVTPVGVAAQTKSLTERAMRVLAGSSGRLPWRELFFADAGAAPLSPEAAGAFAEPLECVRLAPSAANKQPWRVFSDPKASTFHFALSRQHVYDRSISTVSLQEVDLGIALCHFELACRERKLEGSWRRDAQPKLPEGLEYIASWIGERSHP